mmetsp:Transcript_34181/g.86099  ORF Transcript_34181/g.86099 Transcript_34181/m.86099 type:complete len:478 (-) Transcript_34181:806-2239(-)
MAPALLRTSTSLCVSSSFNTSTKQPCFERTASRSSDFSGRWSTTRIIFFMTTVKASFSVRRMMGCSWLRMPNLMRFACTSALVVLSTTSSSRLRSAMRACWLAVSSARAPLVASAPSSSPLLVPMSHRLNSRSTFTTATLSRSLPLGAICASECFTSLRRGALPALLPLPLPPIPDPARFMPRRAICRLELLPLDGSAARRLMTAAPSSRSRRSFSLATCSRAFFSRTLACSSRSLARRAALLSSRLAASRSSSTSPPEEDSSKNEPRADLSANCVASALPTFPPARSSALTRTSASPSPPSLSRAAAAAACFFFFMLILGGPRMAGLDPRLPPGPSPSLSCSRLGSTYSIAALSSASLATSPPFPPAPPPSSSSFSSACSPNRISQLWPTCSAIALTLACSPGSHLFSGVVSARSSTLSISRTFPCPVCSMMGTGSWLASSASNAFTASSLSSSSTPPTKPRQDLEPQWHLSGLSP